MYPTIDSTIGNTPLVRLQRLPAAFGVPESTVILGKLEGNNPAGSVKDRPAYSMMVEAEKRGTIKPGDTLIEATSGNTGIALAMVAAMRGYKMLLIMPENQSVERRQAMKAYGAELVLVSKEKGIEGARDLAVELEQQGKGRVLDQFANPDNPLAHYTGTGPEIWRQTGGEIDGFICAVGSGGTLGGVSMALKARNADVQIGLADPEGASLYSYYTNGELKSAGNSITEGIGQGRITANLQGIQVDRAYQIPDSEALPYVFDLLEHEGLCLGGSSGINVAGAVRLARDLGPGKTIVTILCDYGNRYQSKLYNPAFLKDKGLPVPHWLERAPSIDWKSVLESEPAA